ncbi:MAG: hypothetical protein E6G49_10500 [Actinobacteria bacterium]|nr:MAG: hypothetical protein E6G49_10500 [Actinomycetota bacterium]
MRQHNTGAVRPEVIDIAVPPFSPRLRWLGGEPAPIERICARGPLLVHFIDAAHLSSVRTLPYVTAWGDRYAPHGLTVLGVNSPRFPFTGDEGKLAAALARLDVEFPVALDRDYLAWHDYGCEGWPSLFLWGRGGALRWFHLGEGEYAATEDAIQEELLAVVPTLELPEVLPPARPIDAAGALVARPTPELLPGGSISEPWRAGGPEDALEFDYEAGGAWASVDGKGELEVALDGGEPEAVAVDSPGAYELSAHERHEPHRISLTVRGNVAVYAITFAAGLPA